MHIKRTAAHKPKGDILRSLALAISLLVVGVVVVFLWENIFPVQNTGGSSRAGVLFGSDSLLAWVLICVLSASTAVIFFVNSRRMQQLQVQAQEDQQRSQAFLNVLPDLIILVDRSGTCTDVRMAPEAPPILNSEQIFNKRISEFLPSQSAVALAEAIAATLESNTSHSLELDLEHSKGRSRQIEARVVPYTQTEALIIIREVSDNSYVRRILRELAENVATKTGEEYFKMMVTFLARTLHADYVIVGRIEQATTPTLSCIAGTRGQELIEDTLSFDLEQPPASRTLVGDLGMIVPTGLREHFADDAAIQSPHVGTVTMLPLTDSAGHTSGILLVINGGNSSHNQFAESILQICADRAAGELESETTMQALSHAVDQAEQLNQMKSNMLANLNHEFRTPMNGVLGFAKILQRHIEDPEQRQYAHYIYQSAERLMATLRDVIALAKLESNEISVQWMPVSLTGEVEDLAYSFRTQVEERGLKFTTRIPSEMISCRLDASLLGQAMSNLLDNAMKFTREGEVSIECLSQEIDGEEFGLIRISDTGIGMSKEFQDRAFAAFTQESAGIDRHFEGSGIGLTIVQRFTALMNGRVMVDSQPGRGSTFTLAFPLLDPEQAQREIDAISIPEINAPSDATEGLRIAEKTRILVVEDDMGNQRLIDMYLRDIAEIDQAISGDEAIELSKSNQYDLILFDVNLGRGVREGISVFHQVHKQVRKNGPAPIIAMTAYTLKFTRETFLKEGFNDYIAKPFSDDEIRNLVQKHLGEALHLAQAGEK